MGMKQKSQQDLEVQLKIDREKERIYPTKGEKTVKIKKEEEEAKGTWSPVFVGWVYEGIRLKCEATLAATIKFIVIISHILDIYLVL